MALEIYPGEAKDSARRLAEQTAAVNSRGGAVRDAIKKTAGALTERAEAEKKSSC